MITMEPVVLATKLALTPPTKVVAFVTVTLPAPVLFKVIENGLAKSAELAPKLAAAPSFRSQPQGRR